MRTVLKNHIAKPGGGHSHVLRLGGGDRRPYVSSIIADEGWGSSERRAGPRAAVGLSGVGSILTNFTAGAIVGTHRATFTSIRSACRA
jgi:hypothetical protein